jgi:hypothetical protein
LITTRRAPLDNLDSRGRISGLRGQKIDHLTSSAARRIVFHVLVLRGTMRSLVAAAVFALLCPPVALGQTCGGFERWAVKVGSDPAVSSIDLNNRITTTLHALVNLPRPTLPSGNTARHNDERTVRVVDGRLVQFKLEAGKDGDSDFHLVISDDTLQFSPSGQNSTPSPHSFVAEIVNPDCVMGSHDDTSFPSQLQDQLVAVHTKFVNQFPNMKTSGDWNEEGGIPVRLTGIGFFDKPHGQTGRALNGLELHPLLDIEFNPGGTPIPTPSALLQNPGFESGNVGWTATAGIISNDQNQTPRSGTFNAWLGGYGTPHTDRLSQSITIPATATAVSLTFFLHITTEEQTTTDAFDKLRVQVRRANGQVMTLKTFSNLQAVPGYTQEMVSLTPFKGQTVTIQLVAVEDDGSMTSFLVDDFALVIES